MLKSNYQKHKNNVANWLEVKNKNIATWKLVLPVFAAGFLRDPLVFWTDFITLVSFYTPLPHPQKHKMPEVF